MTDPATSGAGEPPRWRGGPKASLLPLRDGPTRSVLGVIALLAYLAALAAGGAGFVAQGISGWTSRLGGEATIQIMPRPGRDPAADLEAAAASARATPGIASVEPLSRAESEKLLEPWLGRGLDLSDLPVPRLVVLRLAPGGADLAALSTRLAGIPGAALDDHSAWKARLSGYGRGLVIAALATLGLVLAATALAIGLATRGAIATTREVVDVLGLLGATEGFVVREFAVRFRRLGWIGGCAGAGCAILSMALAQALFGGVPFPSATWVALGAACPVAPAVAGLAGLVSSASVRRVLRA